MAGALPALFLNQLRLHEPVMPTGAPKSKRTDPDEGAPAPKATKATKKQHAGRDVAYQTVGVLGAGVGTIIRGLIPSDGVDVSPDSYAAVEGTSFRVVAGTVWALPETQANASEAYPNGDWEEKLAQFQGVRTSDAQMRIGRYAVTDEMASRPALPENLSGALMGMTSGYGSNVQNMRGTDGAEVELEVLTLGPKWSHLGMSIGDRIKPNALAHLLNRHFQDDETKIGFLCLRIHHWVEGKRSGRVSADAPPRPIDEDVHALLYNNPGDDASELYDLEETTGPLSAMKRYRLPVSGDEPFTPDKANAVFVSILRADHDRVHPTMWPTLAHPGVSFGALKSLMQKVARFHPNKDVLFPGGDGGEDYTVSAKVAMLAATLLCLSTKGDGYLPDLHMSVRGTTAACKRLAVIAVEDSWFSDENDRSPALRGLLGLAMATMRMPDYHISHATATKVGRLSTQVVASKQILAWSDKFARAPTGTVKATKEHMVRSAELLRILKSFEGDMKMFEQAAEMVDSTGRISVIAMPEQLVHPDHMPLLHLIDQHVYRGVAHQVLDFPTTQPSNNAFGPRFRTLFHDVTGFNPRLAPAHLDVNTRGEHGSFDEARNPVPAVRRAQYQIGLEVFAYVYPKEPLPAEERAVRFATVSVDPAIISQAVGPIKVPKISTTTQDNLDDYKDDPDPEKRLAAAALPTEWKSLIVLLGTRSSEEVVVFAPSRDTKPKPEITPSVKALAIRAARVKSQEGLGLKFESRLMPLHTHARYDDDTNQWLVTSRRGAASKFWSWEDAMAAETPFVVSPFPIPNEEGDPEWEARLSDDDDGMEAAKKAILTARLENRYLPEAEAEDMQGADDALLRECLQKLVKAIASVAEAQSFVPGNVLSRFLSMIAAQYTTFSVPVPGLQGGTNEKELKPERGDWIVYRALLRLAALAPGALQSSSPKKLAFVVNDARALKHVESQLRSIVRERDAANADLRGGLAQASARRAAAHWQTCWHKLLHDAEGGRTPFQFQKDLVQQMMDRDASPNRTQGQFLSLEVGLGKTVTGMLYALQHLASTPNHGTKRIVWITKRAIVDTTVGELQRWGQDPIAAVKWGAKDWAVNAKNSRLVVLAIETLSGAGSSETLAADLIGMAPHTLFIVDEVHQYYNLSDRASRLLQAVSASPKFLVMTATPAASTRQMLAREWLRRCVNFPVASPDDVLVAGATFISGRYDLGIEATEEEVFVRLSEKEYDEHKAALAVTGGWSQAARVVRDAIELKLAGVAVEEARADRAANPGGGALVVVDSAASAGSLMNKLVLDARSDFRVELRNNVLNATQPTDPDVGIIVVTKDDVTGYNLQRLGVIVTGVYAGNAAHRHQLRGRIRRLGQKRKKVKYATVIGRSTILDLLHERHKSTDSQGATLEAMAALFLNQAEARAALRGAP